MNQPVNVGDVRKIALSFPGVKEGKSYGTPAFRVSGKLLARMHEDGESLVLKMEEETRDIVLQVNPDAFYLTDHYRRYPYVLVRLSIIDVEELKGYLEKAWRNCAPKRLVTAYDQDN